MGHAGTNPQRMSSNTLSLYISFEKAITSKRNRCHYATRVVASLRILANMHPFSGGQEWGPRWNFSIPYCLRSILCRRDDFECE